MTNSDVDQLESRIYNAFNDSGILGLGGTDENEVISVLTSAKENGMMKELIMRYAQNHPGEPSLEDELFDELGGEDLRSAMPLYYEAMTPKTPASPSINDPQWIDQLYEAFKGIGTDEEEIMSVLTQAKTAHQMNDLALLYNQAHADKMSLEDELYDELSDGELKQALKLYYEGIKETQKQPSDSTSTCSTTICDGTLTPG